MAILEGRHVRLRPPEPGDVARLRAIRSAPEVVARWLGGDDPAAALAREMTDPAVTGYVIDLDGRVVGWIEWHAEDEPEYRHAGIDLYVDPEVHGRGVCTDAVRTLARHLIDHHGYHRLVIDPAADNAAAIRCYTKVGFRPVGIMRRYERGTDGTWHDGLLMDLLADELTP